MLKYLGPIVATALVVLILLASSVPLMHWFEAEGRQARFEENAAKWRNHAITGYEFTIRVTEQGGDAEATYVVSPGGNVQRRGEGGAAVVADDLPTTIDALFDTVTASIAEPGDHLGVFYDEDYGYPQRIEIDLESDELGDERLFEVLYFRPLAADR